MTLAGILARYRAEGLFTHAYCARGVLAEPQPRTACQEISDGRDVFDLASLTKALATTALVFSGVQRGALGLDEPVGDLIAGLHPTLATLTLRQILRHETGLPAWRNFWMCHLGCEPPEVLSDPLRKRSRLLEGFNRAALALDPARSQVYSDVGFLLLGLALEERAGKSLMMLFDGFCQGELGFDNRAQPLAYGPALGPALAARAVPTAECRLRGRLLKGEVHDENCASLGGSTGHAGLFGSGPALAGFLHRLSQSASGRLLLAENAAARALVGKDLAQDALLGWRLGNGPSTAPFGGGRAIGHPGFTGVAFWVCPESADYAMLLTNRVISGRLPGPGIAALRREVFTSLAAERP